MAGYWPRWLHLARSGSQSQRAIWFILPARGASHTIKRYIIWLALVSGQDEPNSRAVIGYPSGQDEAYLALDYSLYPAREVSPEAM